MNYVTGTATVTKTAYDRAAVGANAYTDFDGSNAFVMRYLYGATTDVIQARRDASGTVAWYLTDDHGSVRDLANASGTVIDHIAYTAYGKVSTETNPTNGDRFKYTARELDSEIGQYYY